MGTVPLSDDSIVAAALQVLERRAFYGKELSSPSAVRDYLRLKLAGLEREHFMAIWLDAQHRTIGEPELVTAGTLTQAVVHARELVKSALRRNAAAVILVHNHPSGVAEPSAADVVLTGNLRSALGLVDVRVLDHFVIGGGGGAIASFAERGLL